MQGLFTYIAEYAALAIEIVAVVIVTFGAFEAFARSLGSLFGGQPLGWRREVWISFGVWLLLGLQFALAADIVRSVISPTWETIGRLAATAVIRTFLNYFLEKDLVTARGADEAVTSQENGKNSSAKRA